MIVIDYGRGDTLGLKPLTILVDFFRRNIERKMVHRGVCTVRIVGVDLVAKNRARVTDPTPSGALRNQKKASKAPLPMSKTK
jgi:hypothetical protein